MKYAVEMGSSAMICILAFVKISSGSEKLKKGEITDAQTA
jgi:hypothetical protein